MKSGVHVIPVSTMLNKNKRVGYWGSLLIILAVLCCFFAIFFIERMQYLLQSLHPVRSHVTALDGTVARTAMGELSDVVLTTSDGLKLRAWYHPSVTGAVVVFVHGGGNNRMEFLPIASELGRRGIGSLLYDSRANGESDGVLQSWGDKEQADLTAALDFVSARPDVNPMRIGVQGFSIGASTAVMVAAHDRRVHALVLNAVWTSLDDELAYKVSRPQWLDAPLLKLFFTYSGVNLAHVRPMDVISSIAPRAVMMQVGDQDQDTPLAISRALFALAREPKQFATVQGAGHGDYVRRGGHAYVVSIADFFAATLRGS